MGAVAGRRCRPPYLKMYFWYFASGSSRNAAFLRVIFVLPRSFACDTDKKTTIRIRTLILNIVAADVSTKLALRVTERNDLTSAALIVEYLTQLLRRLTLRIILVMSTRHEVRVIDSWVVWHIESARKMKTRQTRKIWLYTLPGPYHT